MYLYDRILVIWTSLLAESVVKQVYKDSTTTTVVYSYSIHFCSSEGGWIGGGGVGLSVTVTRALGHFIAVVLSLEREFGVRELGSSGQLKFG